jgi:hypothetical protein
VLIVEAEADFPRRDRAACLRLVEELQRLAQQHAVTRSIHEVRIYPGKLPTDIRHNSKIFREQLAVWAAHQLRGGTSD